jgi:vitamin B12 transporter
MVFADYEGWDGFKPFTDDTYALFENHGPYHHREYQRTNLGVKYNRLFGDEGINKLDISLQRNTNYTTYQSPASRNNYNKREEYILFAKWDQKISENFSYYLKAYYHSWWANWNSTNLQGIVTTGSGGMEWGYDDWGVNLINSYIFDRGDEIIIGAEYQNYGGHDDYTNIAQSRSEVVALFAQFRPYFGFYPGWKLGIGGRFNKVIDGSESFVWNISNKINFINNLLFIRANIGTSFDLPTAVELFREPTPTSPSTGNPNLKPEESTSINAGIGVQGRYGSLEFVGFLETYKDRIYVGANNIYTNSDEKTKIRGYSIIGTLIPIPTIKLSASFTAQKATENGKKIYRGDVPDSYASISFLWDDIVGDVPLGFGVFANYTGKTYSSLNYFNYSSTNPYEYGEYWVFNTSLYAKILENSKITLTVDNVFNEKYPAGGFGVATDIHNVDHIYGTRLGDPTTVILRYNYEFN